MKKDVLVVLVMAIVGLIMVAPVPIVIIHYPIYYIPPEK
jgi:hypothetical protein